MKMSKVFLAVLIGALFVLTVSSYSSGALTGYVVTANKPTPVYPSVASLIDSVTIDSAKTFISGSQDCAVFNVAKDKPKDGSENPIDYCKRQGFEQCGFATVYTPNGNVQADCNINTLKSTGINQLQICDDEGNMCKTAQSLTVTCCGQKQDESTAITGNILVGSCRTAAQALRARGLDPLYYRCRAGSGGGCICRR